MNISGSLNGAVFQGMRRLQYVQLGGLNVVGSIPWETGFVPLLKKGFLKTISLGRNKYLTGKMLPTDFPRGCSLKTLQISAQESLSGSIPSSISNCQELRRLEIVGVGEIQGPIPWQLCHMCTLDSLYLDVGTNVDNFLNNCTKAKHDEFCRLRVEGYLPSTNLNWYSIRL